MTAPARWSRSPLALAALWLLLCAGLLLLQREHLGSLFFRDPDDALRLVQVRDWLAGQGWFDVSQPRINPPAGGAMHWSRLIDVPIAALILLLRPLLGEARGEMIALIVYPMLLGGLYLLLLRSILTRLLGDDRVMVLAGLLLACFLPFVVMQFAPLRIDHHGWQLLLSLALFRIALGPADARGGALAGLVLALHLSISLEGMPYLALFGALAGLSFLHRASTFAHLLALAISLAAASLVLVLLVKGPGQVPAIWCDAVSRQHLLAFAATAGTLLVADRLIGRAKGWQRLAVAGVAALAGAATLVAVAPQCLAGPFVTLDPLVERVWYRNIAEGLPIWSQIASQRVAIIVPTLLGLAGCALRIWVLADQPAIRRNWLRALVLLAGAFALSLAVARGMYAAHAFAVPGMAVLAVSGWRRARAIPQAVPRIVASLAIMLAVPPVATVAASWAIGTEEETAAVPANQAVKPGICYDPADLVPLLALPGQTVFAPLDIGPALLSLSQHRVVATGHHRNADAIGRVIRVFTSPPAVAEPLVRASGATLLAYCPGMSEADVYASLTRDSLIDALNRGDVPGWLELVAAKRGGVRVYRIRPLAARAAAPAQPGRKTSATPFMQ